MINKIEQSANNSDVEYHYGGTECRLWKFDEVCKIANGMKEFSNYFCESINLKLRVKNILAMKNIPLNTSKDISGRWHADSMRRQYKIFCFLSDVKDGNGQLELIKNTNSIEFKIIKGLIQRRYFNLKMNINFMRFMNVN